MGETAENLVDRYDISRAEQDAFALASQRRTVEGARPARTRDRSGCDDAPRTRPSRCPDDEHPRPDTTLETLARLEAGLPRGQARSRPATRAASPTAPPRWSLMSRVARRGRGTRAARADPWLELGRRAAARSWASAPVPATKKVLERTGLTIDDIELIEINEAFAAQVIACERELKFDRDTVNIAGGGISIGHPIGASGRPDHPVARLRHARHRRVAGPRDALHQRRPGAGRRARAMRRPGTASTRGGGR